MVLKHYGKSKRKSKLLPQGRQLLQPLVWVLPKKPKKRGQPQKTPKATKSTKVTSQKSNTSRVEGEKDPGKPGQTTSTTTTAASADATLVQDECPDVKESSFPIPPSDMTISKVSQASAADVEIT